MDRLDQFGVLSELNICVRGIYFIKLVTHMARDQQASDYWVIETTVCFAHFLRNRRLNNISTRVAGDVCDSVVLQFPGITGACFKCLFTHLYA